MDDDDGGFALLASVCAIRGRRGCFYYTDPRHIPQFVGFHDHSCKSKSSSFLVFTFSSLSKNCFSLQSDVKLTHSHARGGGHIIHMYRV